MMAYNTKDKGIDTTSHDNWSIPSFINIRMKRTKRLSPYSETEIWDREEIFTIIKYEPYKRNKAICIIMGSGCPTS